MQYWTSSLTPHEDVNPSFRVFEVDEATMLPHKVTTYSVNLRDKQPEWKKHHELTEHYGMTDLSPKSFDALSTRIREDKVVANKFVKTLSMGGPLHDNVNCDMECRKYFYCFTRSSYVLKARECLG